MLEGWWLDAMVFGIAAAGVLVLIRETKSKWSQLNVWQNLTSTLIVIFLVIVLVLKILSLL